MSLYKKKKKGSYKAHIKNSYLTNQTKIDKGQLFLQKGTDESRLSNTMVFTCIQSRAKLQGPWRSIDSVLPTGWYMGQLVLGFMMDVMEFERSFYFPTFAFILMSAMKRGFGGVVLFCFSILSLSTIQSAFQLASFSPCWEISHFVLSWGAWPAVKVKRDQTFLLPTPALGRQGVDVTWAWPTRYLLPPGFWILSRWHSEGWGVVDGHSHAGAVAWQWHFAETRVSTLHDFCCHALCQLEHMIITAFKPPESYLGPQYCSSETSLLKVAGIFFQLLSTKDLLTESMWKCVISKANPWFYEYYSLGNSKTLKAD